MHRGWIKDYRKIEDWGWYKKPFMAHLFLHLIRNANPEDKYYLGHLIKRGDVVVGRGKLAFATGLTEQQVRTCIKRLKSTNEITSKSTNKFTIITIVNYDLYQSNHQESNQQINQQPNQQLTNNQPTTNQQLTTTKELKNKEYKNIRIGDIKKENIVKEKKDRFLEFVLLKPEEYEKLVERFGEAETKERIERLNNYLGSKGVKYKSHYHTILNWANKDKREVKNGESKKDDTGHSKYDDVPVTRLSDM